MSAIELRMVAKGRRIATAEWAAERRPGVGTGGLDALEGLPRRGLAGNPLPMDLARPLVRLPVRFCATTLAAEMAALPPGAWVPHPTDYEGNDAALLVTPGGRLEQGFIGPMAPTEALARAPYIRQLMAELGCTWGRSRLMRLAPGAKVPRHVDINYYWRTHWRLHVPVVTNPAVAFTCGGETVHMAAGECWTFDSFRYHEVHNGGGETRVHLVLDTVGGGMLHALLAQAQSCDPGAPAFIAPDGRTDYVPACEQRNAPAVMSPWEMRCHVRELLGHCPPAPALPPVAAALDRFVDRWAAAWAAWGEEPGHLPGYMALALAGRDEVAAAGADAVRLDNGVLLSACLREIVFRMAVTAPREAGAARPHAIPGRRGAR